MLEPLTSEVNADELRLKDISDALRKRTKIVLAYIVLGSLLGFVSYERAPRLYTATATVEMNHDSSSGLNLLNQSPYRELQNHTEVRSTPLATGPGLKQNPVLRKELLKVFSNGLQVVQIMNTRLMSASYTDTDPFRATVLAKTTVDAYLRNNTKERYSAAVKASTWLMQQLNDLQRHLENTHNRVAQFNCDALLHLKSVIEAV